MTLKQTTLNAAHRRLGARLVEFGGWEMPVQYTSILEEHRAVRSAVGLFDVSHMGRILVQGAAAAAGLQRLLTNDLDRLADGRAQYSLLCREDGGILDDLVVYRRAAGDYLLVVNAANRERDFAWLYARLPEVALLDITFQWAMMALQGPAAAPLLERLGAPAADTLRRWQAAELEVAGVRCFVARTGYTGEDGFELICAAAAAETLWSRLIAAGARPCGLGARDTLRLEAALPLYGHELTEETNPYEAGLGWAVALDKGDFCGRAALQAVKEAGPVRRLAGFEMRERGIARAGYPVLVDGHLAGVVTSGGPAPTLGTNIGLAYLPSGLSAPGTPITILVRDRPVAAEIVRTPFYRAPVRARP